MYINLNIVECRFVVLIQMEFVEMNINLNIVECRCILKIGR